jgi:hypothetical protein
LLFSFINPAIHTHSLLKYLSHSKMVTQVLSLDELNNIINSEMEIDYELTADMLNKHDMISIQDITPEELMEWYPPLVYEMQRQLLQDEPESTRKKFREEFDSIKSDLISKKSELISKAAQANKNNKKRKLKKTKR